MLNYKASLNSTVTTFGSLSKEELGVCKLNMFTVRRYLRFKYICECFENSHFTPLLFCSAQKPTRLLSVSFQPILRANSTLLVLPEQIAVCGN